MQTAKELYQEYHKTATDLVNQYCQFKQVRPLEPLPNLSKAIWRNQTLTFGWQAIASKLAGNQYYQQG